MAKIKSVKAWAMVSKSGNLLWWTPPLTYAIYGTEKHAKADKEFQQLSRWEIVPVFITPISKRRKK